MCECVCTCANICSVCVRACVLFAPRIATLAENCGATNAHAPSVLSACSARAEVGWPTAYSHTRGNVRRRGAKQTCGGHHSRRGTTAAAAADASSSHLGATTGHSALLANVARIDRLPPSVRHRCVATVCVSVCVCLRLCVVLCVCVCVSSAWSCQRGAGAGSEQQKERVLWVFVLCLSCLCLHSEWLAGFRAEVKHIGKVCVCGCEWVL